MKLATLKFYDGNLSFSAGHFTIFSATQRERLHGHNYRLEAAVTAPLLEPGITFDYAIFRNKLAELCQSIHSKFLLPALSPYLQIEENTEHYRVTFNNKYMLLLKEDVMLLSLHNITIEELSHWFVDQLIADQNFIRDYNIHEISVKVFNGPGHSAKTKWDCNCSSP
jgi:6-pyruvoyltetrahydropterin/6-carboxytetrahydropterin synthase